MWFTSCMLLTMQVGVKKFFCGPDGAPPDPSQSFSGALKSSSGAPTESSGSVIPVLGCQQPGVGMIAT